MADAPRSFRNSVKRKAGQNRPTLSFTLDWIDEERLDEDGDPTIVRQDTFHATMPTQERMFLLAAIAGDDDSNGAAAIVELLRDALPPAEFKVMRTRLRDQDDEGATLEILEEVVEWLMKEWSDFPTKPSSDSSTSQGSTGTKSTGRVRGPGSTH